MFIDVPFINSTGFAIVAEADFRCGVFLSEKSCRHKLVVFTSFWSWLLNVSSVLTSSKYTATFFWIFNALWVFRWFIRVMGLDFGIYVSETCLFLCSSLMRYFVLQNFS